MSPRLPIFRFCIILITVIVLFGSGQRPVQSIADLVFIVNSTDDIVDFAPGNSVCSANQMTGGPCTLRAAITEANLNITTPYQNIIIKISPGVYNLTIKPNYSTNPKNDNRSGDLNIDFLGVTNTNKITIEPLGGGPVIIKNTVEDRILSIDQHNIVIINNLTMQDGNVFQDADNINGGGAIVNKATLTLNKVSLLANSVSCRSGNSCSAAGGAIENWGNLTIENSTLDGNSARQGSAIWHSGTSPYGNLSISYSTLSNNHCGTSGAIINYSNLEIFNSTFSGNTSANETAAGIYNSGTLRLRSTTFANLGDFSSILNTSSGIASFIADNIFKAEPGRSNCSISGTWNSEGYNISNDNSCQLDTVLGDGDLSSIDPQLGGFGNWGGLTKTYMLSPGSPALDHRKTVCQFISNYLIDDQRHWARSDGKCDTGAYEFSPWHLYLPVITK